MAQEVANSVRREYWERGRLARNEREARRNFIQEQTILSCTWIDKYDPIYCSTMHSVDEVNQSRFAHCGRLARAPSKDIEPGPIADCQCFRIRSKSMGRNITLIFSLLAVIAGSGFQPAAEGANVSALQQANSTKQTRALRLVPNRISLSGDRTFDLYLPEDFSIRVAAQGLKRVRFMAKSPEGRIFVTDMYNLADNTKGVVYILDEFDPVTGSFKKVTPYLTGLRNPNSIAFFKDHQGTEWFYLALTDRLVRYKYIAGENAPTAKPEVLATFPDYGLSYKYGGWHLTRTIAIGANGKLYISVGSSCNACEENEEVRASVLEMDTDGKNQRHFARGLRNAVGLRWAKDGLFATNMGSDHLGDHKPADTMYSLKDNTHYGWPYCFQSGAGRFPDPKFNKGAMKGKENELPQSAAGLRGLRCA